MLENEYRLVRLFGTSSAHVVNHYSGLSDNDIRLRFGYNPSKQNIEKYVGASIGRTDNSRTNADFWFGIKHGVNLVATLHVAIRDDFAEFAFTTDVEHRGKKLGQLLFARGYQLVAEYSIRKIVMQCLKENAPMRHIAKKFGLTVVSNGFELESSISVPHHISISDMDQMKTLVIES